MDTDRLPTTRGPRGNTLTPEKLAALHPHVINLSDGRLSNTGRYKTTAGHVEEIFARHLPEALREAKSRREKLRIVIWAHGGLIDEESGLAIAHLQVEWWKRNFIYPLHFAWETGLLDALRQLLGGARELDRVARDLADYTTDPLVEAAARTVGAGKIWGAMKHTAERASEQGGGARLVAEHLKAFCDSHPTEVELHAVGHSAGSIFHAYFLPMAKSLGVPRFETVQFLAPAITTDLFKSRLLGAAGDVYGRMRMYTMSRGFEQDDNVVRVYRKSLLYLIYQALEPEPRTDLLGLEISVRSDADLMKFFGLSDPSSPHEVLWSVSRETHGRNASRSRTHGGFDNDRATMDSLVWSIRDEVAESFPEEEARGLTVDRLPSAPTATTMPAVRSSRGATGRRRALCVGIDEYEGNDRLYGCVADARSWQKTLELWDFDVTLLRDADATHARILDEMEQLVGRADAGDLIVFQYAGHGTQVMDVDGDEDEHEDEALVPHDYQDGRFLLDDELYGVFSKLSDRASLTCFMDCCHSHTNTRKFMGPRIAGMRSTRSAGGDSDVRARLLTVSRELEQRHLEYRRSSRARSGRTTEEMRSVSFAACEANEKAYESGGQGDFTRVATTLLQARPRITHDAFLNLVLGKFGDKRRQTPRLDSPVARRSDALFGGSGTGDGDTSAGPGGRDLASVASELRDLADALEGVSLPGHRG